MSADPAISIVLPTYNGARFLGDAIRGVTAQTFTDWELVIVDDASTDATPALIAAAAAADPRVRAVRHEVNRRLPAALNTGFAAARGRYLAWTSDDNWYRPNALERLASFLDRNPRVDVVYADYTRVPASDPGAARLVRARGPAALVETNVVGPCFLYRRAVHDALGGYREDLHTVEDYEFWLRAAARFRLEPLHEDLYVYRDHEQSLTAREPERIRTLTDRVRAAHVARLSMVPRTERASALIALAIAAWRGHDRAEALRRGTRAVALAPWSPVRYGFDWVRRRSAAIPRA